MEIFSLFWGRMVSYVGVGIEREASQKRLMIFFSDIFFGGKFAILMSCGFWVIGKFRGWKDLRFHYWVLCPVLLFFVFCGVRLDFYDGEWYL